MDVVVADGWLDCVNDDGNGDEVDTILMCDATPDSVSVDGEGCLNDVKDVVSPPGHLWHSCSTVLVTQMNFSTAGVNILVGEAAANVMG